MASWGLWGIHTCVESVKPKNYTTPEGFLGRVLFTVNTSVTTAMIPIPCYVCMSQQTLPEDAPVLVLLPGLTGGSGCSYVLHAVRCGRGGTVCVNHPRSIHSD